ncbi:hypothetical protein A3749_12545 [Oleiphilus sp. HI0078]|nr:hypothetical protein A3749_12545 [Oleiphilus sp. HI0078]
MEAANVQVALDKKDLDTIDTAGGGEFVNPQSFAQFEENGGSGVGTISFSPDGSGKPVNVSTLTQSSATSDDSSEFKEGTHADKGKIADLMDTTTEGVLSDAGLNLAKQALSGESRATENSLIDGMSDAMYGSFNASDTDSSAIQANAGADAQIDLSGLLKLGAGALKKMGGDKGPEGGVIDKVADLADTFGLKMKAGAGWSGANTDKDSRDVQGRALMAYILESYQEQYDLADSEIEQTRIANEMADVMMTTKDSLDQAFLEIGGNELDDININNETMNDEVLDWMEDMQEIRDEKYGR